MHIVEAYWSKRMQPGNRIKGVALGDVDWQHVVHAWLRGIDII